MRDKILTLEAGVNLIDIDDFFKGEDLRLVLVSTGASLGATSTLYIGNTENGAPFTTVQGTDEILVTVANLQEVIWPTIYRYSIRSGGVVIAHGRFIPSPTVWSP